MRLTGRKIYSRSLHLMSRKLRPMTVKHYKKLSIIILLIIGIVLWIIHLYKIKKTP